MKAFWEGFEKRANLLHTTELAGLGVLGVPSAQELAHKKVSEKKKALYELGGLGILGIPSAIAAGRGTLNLAKKLKSIPWR